MIQVCNKNLLMLMIKIGLLQFCMKRLITSTTTVSDTLKKKHQQLPVSSVIKKEHTSYRWLCHMITTNVGI